MREGKVRMAQEPNGSGNRALSPEERHAEFLREHEERMRRVDEALEEVRQSDTPDTPRQSQPAGV
jgi:hypothetical protein